jgi:hypothetical protein
MVSRARRRKRPTAMTMQSPRGPRQPRRHARSRASSSQCRFLISRKTQRLYVRQAFAPIFEPFTVPLDPSEGWGTEVPMTKHRTITGFAAVALLAAAAALLRSLVPASAKPIYPTQPCRVFVDTNYTQIAEQCGTVGRFYPRRLFVRASRPSSSYYGPYY